MVNVNPNDPRQQKSYEGTLNRFTDNKIEKISIELLFKLADTNKDGNVDENELRTLDKNLSDKSIFGDGVFDNNEFKDYVKDYNKLFKSDEALMLEFSKEDMAKLKDKDMKNGISKAMFDKFKEFCNIRLGNGNVNNQLGINGKLSLDANVSSTQDQTGDCYLLTAMNLLSQANGGDISDYVKPDGKGGGVISYKGLTNSQGGKFDAKVSEKELSLARKYQDENPTKRRDYSTGALYVVKDNDGKTTSILSKGDDDVLAFEMAHMKYSAYHRVMNEIACPNEKTPGWIKDTKTKLLDNYLKGLSPDDRKELSRAILTVENLEAFMENEFDNMSVEPNEIDKYFVSNKGKASKSGYTLSEDTIKTINEHPKALEYFKRNFYEFLPEECRDSVDKPLDKSCIQGFIAFCNKYSSKEYGPEAVTGRLKEVIQAIKLEDGVKDGTIKYDISEDVLKNHKINDSGLRNLFSSSIKQGNAACEKLEAYFMNHFSNIEITNNDMLKNYHNLISEGGYPENVLKALSGAESISTSGYKSIYETSGKKSITSEDAQKFDNNRKAEIKQWLENAKEQGFPHVAVTIDSDHEVLFKDFDAETGTLTCYNPWDMNKEEKVSLGRISGMTAMKLPPQK